MTKHISVTKASGVTEPFSVTKLRKSLTRSGASLPEINAIIDKLMPELYNGISTKKIYSKAFRLLKKNSKHCAARFHIKQSMMELGPSGFPFEKFIAKLFEKLGYATSTGQFIKGKCVTHEVDVVARKQNEIILGECKYRNTQGITVDVKTPLYIRARFDDIKANGSFIAEKEKLSGWLVTNAKFTGDAVAYGTCSQLNLMSWDYPFGQSLKDKIDEFALYPLTCLTTLTTQEKQWLLARNYVLAKDVYHDTKLLQKAGLSQKRLISVKEEGEKLVQKTDAMAIT